MRYKKEDILLFACIEKNIGDDLFIKTLCDRYPDKQFIISNRANYGSLASIPNLKFSKELELWLLFDSVTSKNIMKKIVANILKIILRFLLNKHEIAVYIVGNAFKNVDYKGENQIRWLYNRIKLANEFYLLSTNFGSYTDERWKTDAATYFKKITDICFRDQESFSLFSELPNVRYAPDAILSIGKRQKTEQKEKQILISVIDCSFDAREEWLKELTETYENKIIDIIKDFEQMGYEIVLINSNVAQDSPASNRICKKCKSNKIKVFDYQGDIEELEKLYRNAECVVGTRLHTIILAWLFGLPVFPIVYDIKVENMLKSYNFSGEYIDISDVESLDVSNVKKALLEDIGDISNEIIEAANQQFAVLDMRLHDGKR